MIHECGPAAFPKVNPLFQGHKQYVPVLAVTQGHFPGRVFVDDLLEPRTAIVWAVGRWAYIEGDPDNAEFNAALAGLVRQTIIPDSLRMETNWFELYANHSRVWMRNLELCLADFDPCKHLESVYAWDTQKYLEFRSEYSFPPELPIDQIEIPILPARVCRSELIAEDFKTRTAIGFRLLAQDRVVTQSRSNGFTSGAEFMIDVETFDRDDRCRGYATAVTVALLDFCLQNRLIPLWETTEDNTASQRLAQKLGFVVQETYPVYAIEF